MNEKRTQRFTLLEENILKPSPTLVPALLQAQQETPGMGGDESSPGLQQSEALLLPEVAWGQEG